MKKKVIYIVCLIVFSFATIVVYQELVEYKRSIDPLVKKLKRMRLKFYPFREIGDDLEEYVYYYVNSPVEIEGIPYNAPVLVTCRTTDCFSQSTLNTDVSIKESWNFDPDDDESQIKAFFDALDAIQLDYPGIYGVKLISLSFYGQISHEQWWQIQPLIPIDDENF